MGLSFNSVYRTLVPTGMAYRRIDMLRRWHALEGFAATLNVIETMYIDKPIPKARHLYPEGDIGDSYRYRTETMLQHRETGEETEEPFTILSDEPLSLSEIEKDVQDFILRYPYLDDYVITETHLTEAMIREA